MSPWHQVCPVLCTVYCVSGISILGIRSLGIRTLCIRRDLQGHHMSFYNSCCHLLLYCIVMWYIPVLTSLQHSRSYLHLNHIVAWVVHWVPHTSSSPGGVHMWRVMALIEIHIGLPHSNKKLQCYRFPPPWIAECSPSYVATKQMGNLYNICEYEPQKVTHSGELSLNHNQQQQGRSRVSARILHTYVHRCHFENALKL